MTDMLMDMMKAGIKNSPRVVKLATTNRAAKGLYVKKFRETEREAPRSNVTSQRGAKGPY